jgi:hypothetical protein
MMKLFFTSFLIAFIFCLTGPTTFVSAATPCAGDYSPADGDVDGEDLSQFDFGIDLSTFAEYPAPISTSIGAASKPAGAQTVQTVPTVSSDPRAIQAIQGWPVAKMAIFCVPNAAAPQAAQVAPRLTVVAGEAAAGLASVLKTGRREPWVDARPMLINNILSSGESWP